MIELTNPPPPLLPGSFADTRMTTNEMTDFKKEIEELKQRDPRNIHSLGLVDFDVFLSKTLSKYRSLANRAKTHLINAFAACDLDDNGVCNLNEFLVLNRHIEAENYDEDTLTAIFDENADRIIEDQPNLSFEKFAVVCVDHNLFNEDVQDKFLGLRHKKEIPIRLAEL